MNANIVTYNIQYGKGRDNKIDLKRISREIHGADIIALQEVERFWPRTGNVDQVAFFKNNFPEYFYVYGPGVDIHVEGAKPRQDKRRQFGNMILSKFPILMSRHHLLPKRGSIGPLSIQRSAIEATICVGDLLLRIYSVHLTHLSSETRLPQVKKLLQINQDMLMEGYAVEGTLSGLDWQCGVVDQSVADSALFLGDFNFQPDSREYLEIVGPISDYGGHITSQAGFVDAWCECGGDKFAGCTSDVGGQPARLDYCFSSAKLRKRLITCEVDEAAIGSDHLPVWLNLDVSSFLNSRHQF